MKLQDYNDGGIYKLSQNSYEVRTSQGTGKGSTVAEALEDLANKQVKPKKRKRTSKENLQVVEKAEDTPVDS